MAEESSARPGADSVAGGGSAGPVELSSTPPSEERLKQIDESVHEVAEAIQSAVRWGMAHRDDPAALTKAIQDCRDLLNQVLDAEVLNW
ncbi:MAG: hypothetical protein KGJ86_05850 [Chloroflexota bacterium]|nr:hypothetical protein [Chloroflexota bacterium]